MFKLEGNTTHVGRGQVMFAEEASTVLTSVVIFPRGISMVRDVLHSFCVFEMRVRPVGDAVLDSGSLRKSTLSELPLCCRTWLCTPH